MNTCTIRVKLTGEVVRVKSYGNGWTDAKGKFYHRSQAELINVHND